MSKLSQTNFYVPRTTVSSRWSPHHSLSKSNSFSVALVLTREKTNHTGTNNRSLPSCLVPLCQNESMCKSFIRKCVPLTCSFSCTSNSFFCIKCFAPGFVLRPRHKVTRKWPLNKPSNHAIQRRVIHAMDEVLCLFLKTTGMDKTGNKRTQIIKLSVPQVPQGNSHIMYSWYL